MDIIWAILTIPSSIANWFSLLITRIWNFFSAIINFIWNVIWIFKALWYGLTSLLSGLWDLIVEIFNWDVFVNVNKAFISLSNYIWWAWTVFIATMLFLIIFRIWVAFVFKLLRLNIDYHSLQEKTKNQNRKSVNFSDKGLFGK